MKKVGLKNIQGIGIGAPNGNIHTGTIDYAPSLPWNSLFNAITLQYLFQLVGP
jgi:hypothetical protein